MAKIIVKKVDSDPVVVDVDKLELEDMQALVGRFIEALHVGGEIDMWLNDSGKINGLPVNLVLGSQDYEILDTIHGDIFFASSTPEGETVGLSDPQITWIKNNFESGEWAISRNGHGEVVFVPVWVYNPTAS